MIEQLNWQSGQKVLLSAYVRAIMSGDEVENSMKTGNEANISRIEQRRSAIAKEPTKPYFIRYSIETGKFSKEDASENQGLTQDLVYISCITNPYGSYSQIWHAVSGFTDKPMHHADVFKAWILMASSLREKEDLDPGIREFLDNVFETWRQSVLRGSGRTGKWGHSELRLNSLCPHFCPR